MAVEAPNRLRLVIAIGYIGLANLASCSPDTASPDPAVDPTGNPPTQSSVNQTANTQGPPPGARLVERESIPTEQLLAAILNECHPSLQKRMTRVKVTVTLPSKRRLLVQMDLPDCARIQEGKRDSLWVNNKIYRLDDTKGDTAKDIEANRALIQPLARMVDAIAFGPLYRATKSHRDGDDVILTDQDGLTTTLQLHDNTLLPRALIYPDNETVRFNDYLRTKSSWIVKQATLAPLGTCDTFFEDGGLVFASNFFEPPGSSKQIDSERIRMTSPGVARESESTIPITVIGKAAKWVAMTSSNDWQQRHEMYAPVHAELESQNQRIFGFPMIWKNNGQTMLGVPFRKRDNGNEFTPPDNWDIASSPRTTQLVVYPPSGSVAERILTGTAQLQRSVANRRLKMIGPIIAQPFVHLHEGVPTKSKLADCKVRMSVRIESP